MPQAQFATAAQPLALCQFRRITFPGAWFYEVKSQQPLDTELIATQLRQQYGIHWNRLVLHGLTTPTSIHGHRESLYEYSDYQKLLVENNWQELEVGEWVCVTQV